MYIAVDFEVGDDFDDFVYVLDLFWVGGSGDVGHKLGEDMFVHSDSSEGLLEGDEGEVTIDGPRLEGTQLVGLAGSGGTWVFFINVIVPDFIA